MISKPNERFIILKSLKNPRFSGIKVTTEFNKNFCTWISPETARPVVRESGLNEHSFSRPFS